MIDGWALWLLLVGLALGAAAMWLLLVRVPRQEDDVSPEEQHSEAAWISSVIERDGGIAPESLVEEVLQLHQTYLRNPNEAPELVVPAPAVPESVDPRPLGGADGGAGVAPAVGLMEAGRPPAPPPGYAPTAVPSATVPSPPAQGASPAAPPGQGASAQGTSIGGPPPGGR